MGRERPNNKRRRLRAADGDRKDAVAAFFAGTDIATIKAIRAGSYFPKPQGFLPPDDL